MKNVITIVKAWNQNKDGYMTVEMTIIFPAIFLSLLLILFMGMVLYQEVTLQSIAVQASERGSVTYSSRVTDMTTNIKTLEDFKHRDPYRNVPLIDNGTKEDYIFLINQYVADRIGKRDIMSGVNRNAGSYTSIDDYLIAKRIRVNIQNDYHMPVDSVSEIFGHDGIFDVNTTAVSAVVDAPDFVRNVDIVTDIVKQTKVFGTVEKGYNHIKDALTKVTDLLEKE